MNPLTLEETYLKARRLILWQCNRRCPDDLEAADELAAEANYMFVKLWSSFDPAVHRWEVLVKFAVRSAAENLKRREAKQERILARARERLAALARRKFEAPPEPDEAGQRAAAFTRVRSAVARLDPPARSLVRQRFGLGRRRRTFADLAAEFGVSKQAVQGRLHRAVGRLREELTPAAL